MRLKRSSAGNGTDLSCALSIASNFRQSTLSVPTQTLRIFHVSHSILRRWMRLLQPRCPRMPTTKHLQPLHPRSLNSNRQGRQTIVCHASRSAIRSTRMSATSLVRHRSLSNYPFTISRTTPSLFIAAIGFSNYLQRFISQIVFQRHATRKENRYGGSHHDVWAVISRMEATTSS